MEAKTERALSQHPQYPCKGFLENFGRLQTPARRGNHAATHVSGTKYHLSPRSLKASEYFMWLRRGRSCFPNYLLWFGEAIGKQDRFISSRKFGMLQPRKRPFPLLAVK